MTYHDQRRSGMLIYMINYQCDAASGLVMAVPPLAQSALTLVGMFWITLLIDAMSLQYLAGAEIDYKEDLQGAQFVIRNPNAKTTCGCGSSFSA